MNNKSPSINKAFHIIAAITIISIYLLLNWVVEVRTNDFIKNQSSVAARASESIALEISTYIENRRKLLHLLQQAHSHELAELIKNPYDTELRQHIKDSLKSIFPEMINFTLASNEGKQVLPRISDFVIGKGCQSNLNKFANGYPHSIFIHSNPRPEHYHFDILSQVSFSEYNDGIALGIIFISVSSSVIEEILKKRAPDNHFFYLVKRSNSDRIEVSAEGDRGSLDKKFISQYGNEVESSIKVNKTSWDLVSTFNQQAIVDYRNNLENQTFQIKLFCLISGLLVSGLFYRTDKKRIEAQSTLFNSNIILEDKVKQRTKELNYRATHDQLTKLINRGEFENRLTKSLQQAKLDGTYSILMYLDLDQFKIINDTAGHAAGDELLIQVSALLKSKLDENDTLARLGGDEFGILINCCDLDKAQTIAEALRSAIADYDFMWESLSFTFGVSIGVIQIDKESTDLKEILSLVDAACYMAKDLGRNQYYIYNEEDTLFQSKQKSMFLNEHVLSAIKNNQLELHGQKIANLSNNGHNHWYEILVRIKQNGELLYPDSFIPSLEQFGHINILDSAVFKQSVLFLEKNPNYKLSINLSALSVIKPEFITLIKDSIKKHQVEPSSICLEITETAVVNNLKCIKNFIDEIHKIGCSIALDDFGTGMSSFSYLQNLNIDYIKLDGSFVKDIDRDPIHYTMVSSINAIAKAMNKYVVAEYVENEAVHEKLIAIGVSNGQGYFIHKPEKLDDIVSS